MAYNLGGTFKDVLKVISLGIMASINGVSGDVIAMDSEDEGFSRGLSFLRCHAAEYQSNLDPDSALRLALELSLQEVPSHEAGAASAAAAEDEDPADALDALFSSAATPEDDAAIAQALNDLELHENLMLQIQREKERSRFVAENGPEAESLRKEFTAASSWDVDVKRLGSKDWNPSDVEEEQFSTHILQQAREVFFNQIQSQNPHCVILEALPYISESLKAANTGLGVSDKIDEILKGNFL